MSAERVNQLVEAGLWLRLSGDVDGARRLFEQALKLDPVNPRVRELLGNPVTAAAELPQELKGARAHAPEPASAPSPVARPLGPIAPKVAPVAASGGAPVEELSFEFEAPPAKVQTAWDRAGTRVTPVEVPAARATEARDALEVLADPSPPAFTRTPPPVPVSADPDDLERLIKDARELQELDNHTGALELIHKALAQHPKDQGLEAMREQSERTLLAMVESKLGDLAQRPRIRMRPDEVIWLNLDHRAGFVLAQIDGSVSYEELFLVSGMSRLDTARILAQLKESGAIG